MALLQVSSFNSNENIFCPKGVVSQTSPISSLSESFWSVFGVSGQLSTSFLTLSLSLSSDFIIRVIESDLVKELDSALMVSG